MPGPQETTDNADVIRRICVPQPASHGLQDRVGVIPIEDVGGLREDKAGRKEEKQGNTEQHCGRWEVAGREAREVGGDFKSYMAATSTRYQRS